MHSHGNVFPEWRPCPIARATERQGKCSAFLLKQSASEECTACDFATYVFVCSYQEDRCVYELIRGRRNQRLYD